MSQTITLDVREDIRAGREPLSRIVATADQLQPDEQLLVIAPFEPVPLFAFLKHRGFAHAARQIAPDHWEVLFTRDSAAQPTKETPVTPPPAAATGAQDAGGVLDVDARGLEPPQPLVKILEALAGLPAGAELRARTDRRPMHLYPQLAGRGFAAETEEQSDGSYLTHIRAR
jgi:uncharacterized protein (DUF2249 family)